jgi:hypothetical protein
VNKIRLTLLFVVLMPTALVAQDFDFMRQSEVVLCGGAMNYIGDLNNQTVLLPLHAAGGIGLRTRLDNRWALRIDASYGRISCEKDYIKLRNLSFRNDVFELCAMAEFNFRPFGQGATEAVWTPYIFGGIGVFYHNPMALCVGADGDQQWVALQPLCTEGQGTSLYPERRPYALVQLCMPFGVGFKWRISKVFSLTAEYGFRKTWTDYLDDVSTTYVDASLLEREVIDGDVAVRLSDRSGEVEAGYVNAAGIKRGDDSLKDWYAFMNVSLGVSLETMFGWMRPKRCKL